MKVSSVDVRQIVAYALGGFVLFGGYALGDVFTRKKIGEPLIIETKAVQEDELLRGLLSELQRECCTPDKIGVIRLIACVDHIVEKRSFLDTNPSEVDPNMRIRAVELLTNMKQTHIPRLRDTYGNTNKAKLQDLNALLDKIYERAREHVNNIYTLTTNYPQNKK